MLTLEKRQATQAGTFNSSSRNLITFRIPGGKVYDLSKSYVALTTSVDFTKSGAEEAGALHNISLKHTPQCLVRNVQFSTSKVGDIENIQNINVLNSTMNTMAMNYADRQSQAVFNGGNYQDEYGNNYSNFADLHRSKASVSRTPQLNIPIRDLFSGMGRFQNYPSQALGSTTINLELESDALCLQESRRYTAANQVGCDDTAETTKVKATITGGYKHNVELGLWVGASVLISGEDGGVAQTHNANISAISAPDPTDDKIEITYDPARATGAWTTVKLEQVLADSLSYKVEKAQIVLVEVNLPSSERKRMSSSLNRGVNFDFLTWEKEEDNMSALPSFNRNYYINPNAENSALLFTDTTSLVSSLSNFDKFRTAINNIETTETDVVDKSPLYRDMMMRQVARMGYPLRELPPAPPAFILQDVAGADKQLQYQVRLDASTGNSLAARRVHLFKQVNRTLDVKSKAVRVN